MNFSQDDYKEINYLPIVIVVNTFNIWKQLCTQNTRYLNITVKWSQIWPLTFVFLTWHDYLTKYSH